MCSFVCVYVWTPLTMGKVCILYVAVCCSVLQCVAMCCSVLQCLAVCCNVLQRARRKEKEQTSLKAEDVCVRVCVRACV